MSNTWRDLREAERDARSHVEKGTGLSDEAVKRICRVLLEVVHRNDEAMAALEAKLRAEGNPDVVALDAHAAGRAVARSGKTLGGLQAALTAVERENK